MDIYRELILDHYKHPRNFGHLKNPTASAEEYNATCGDRIRIEIKGSRSQIDDIRFSGEGCAISQASASLLTEKIRGMSATKIMKLKTADILKLLGTTLTPSRVKCAVLPLEVLDRALEKIEQSSVK